MEVPHPELPLRDLEHVVVEEHEDTEEEDQEVYSPQEHNPLSIRPDPVLWPSSNSQKSHPEAGPGTLSMSTQERSAALTQEQKMFLLCLIKEKKEVMSKKIDYNTVEKKRIAWQQVTDAFNAAHPRTVPKKATQLKRAWVYMRAKAKADDAQYKKIKKASGDEPLTPPEYDILTEEVLKILNLNSGSDKQNENTTMDQPSPAKEPSPSSPFVVQEEDTEWIFDEDGEEAAPSASDYTQEANPSSPIVSVPEESVQEATQGDPSQSSPDSPSGSHTSKKAARKRKRGNLQNYSDFEDGAKEIAIENEDIPDTTQTQVAEFVINGAEKTASPINNKNVVVIIRNSEGKKRESTEHPLLFIKEKNQNTLSRTSPISSRERDFLLSLIMKEKVLHNRKTDGETSAQKHQAWSRITKTFNALDYGPRRTETQIRKIWERLKAKAKEARSVKNCEDKSTTGGCALNCEDKSTGGCAVNSCKDESNSCEDERTGGSAVNSCEDKSIGGSAADSTGVGAHPADVSQELEEGLAILGYNTEDTGSHCDQDATSSCENSNSRVTCEAEKIVSHQDTTNVQEEEVVEGEQEKAPRVQSPLPFETRRRKKKRRKALHDSDTRTTSNAVLNYTMKREEAQLRMLQRREYLLELQIKDTELRVMEAEYLMKIAQKKWEDMNSSDGNKE